MSEGKQCNCFIFDANFTVRIVAIQNRTLPSYSYKIMRVDKYCIVKACVPPWALVLGKTFSDVSHNKQTKTHIDGKTMLSHNKPNPQNLLETKHHSSWPERQVYPHNIHVLTASVKVFHLDIKHKVLPLTVPQYAVIKSNSIKVLLWVQWKTTTCTGMSMCFHIC